MKWRASYSDGSELWDGPGAYPRIDRARLEVFELFPEDYAGGLPILAVLVPEDRRLVYRRRTTLSTDGTMDAIILVALESQDRRTASVWVLRPVNGGTAVIRQQGYGDHEPPELQPEEL